VRVTFLGESRDEYEPDDWMAAFARIRIVNIGFLFPFAGFRIPQSHDLGAELAVALLHLKSGIVSLPESDRGWSVGCTDCGCCEPESDQRQEQRLKSRSFHTDRHVFLNRPGRLVLLRVAHSQSESQQNRLTGVLNLVEIA
jgi:hypothetical protein